MADASLYNKLTETAKNFVLATSPKVAGTNEPASERFLSFCAPDFGQAFGHKHFVSTKPGMQHRLTAQGFLDHQGTMAKFLHTWSVEPTDVCVDVAKRKAVVRVDFHMMAKGASEDPVLNDIIYWITMDESGEKVVEAVEFVDPVASAALQEKMQAGSK